MKSNHRKAESTRKRVIFTLPRKVVDQVQRYARLVRGGNKSGFVADAIEAYITNLRKAAHTRKLRKSYAAAAGDSLEICTAWEPLSDEVWARLEEGGRVDPEGRVHGTEAQHDSSPRGGLPRTV